MVVILLLFVGLPRFGDRYDDMAQPDALVVDVLTVDEVTNVPPTRPAPPPREASEPRRAQVQPVPAPSPPPPPPPPAQTRPAPAVPSTPARPVAETPPATAPEILAARPQAKPAPPPAPPAPEPRRTTAAPAETAPSPPAPPAPEPEPRRTTAAPSPPAPPRQEDGPATGQDFQTVLRTVEGLQPSAPSEPTRPTPEPEPQVSEAEARSFDALISDALSGPAAGAPGRSFDPDRPMTISEIDEVRRQIERCWNIPAGAREARDLVVTVRVEMAPDGRPRMAQIVEDRRLSDDGFYRAAAESALRAVLNDRCHPFRLPPEKYERWRTMTLIFNPKDMVGS
ncbi:MAG: hypothetical protein EA406_11565 [Rhodospirillales bacterium]|nr:MAG: hypothetical protein EA406_11565 [Rhodospirillales bacterium]